VTANDKERLLRALRRLRASGNRHPTDSELGNESALPIEMVRKERERIQKLAER
jgi:hypothetical protein